MDTHTFQPFDDQLTHLHQHVQAMARITLEQFDNILSALNQGDTDLAVKAIQQDNRVDRYEVMIDAEIINILACHQPVAVDLRTLIAISKITTELERIGDELVKMGSLVIDLYADDAVKPSRKLLDSANQAAKTSNTLLMHTFHTIETSDAVKARQLIENEDYLSTAFNNSLGRQFSMLIKDVRLISSTLEILQLITGLMRCNTHCINIAEYIVFMIDGADIRHQKSV